MGTIQGLRLGSGAGVVDLGVGVFGLVVGGGEGVGMEPALRSLSLPLSLTLPPLMLFSDIVEGGFGRGEV